MPTQWPPPAVPPPPPPRGRVRVAAAVQKQEDIRACVPPQVGGAAASASSSSPVGSVLGLQSEQASSSSLSFGALSQSSLDGDDVGCEGERQPALELHRGLRLRVGPSNRECPWRAVEPKRKEERMGPGSRSPLRQQRSSTDLGADSSTDVSSTQRLQRRSPRKPLVPTLNTKGRSKPRAQVQEEKHDAREELEGTKTIESRVENIWARWLCRSLAGTPTPHWCGHKDAPPLPLPAEIDSSVVMALILGQLLPPSALPPALVSLMTGRQSKGPEKWVSVKAQGAGEKRSSAVRRVVDDALRVLQRRSSTLPNCKTLPAASLLVNGTPVAVMQVMGICKALALQRIRGDLEKMMRWYQAALQAVARRVAEQHQMSPQESALLFEHFMFPKGFLTGLSKHDASPGQLWAVFRTGVVFAGGVSVFYEGSRAQRKNERQTQAGMDLSQVYADPRLIEQLRSNVDYVFQALDAARLPRIWTQSAFLTFPDEDDTFLLIQAYALYQTFSQIVPLRDLERSISSADVMVDETVLTHQSRSGLMRQMWTNDTNTKAFCDIRWIVGQKGQTEGARVRGTWRQPMRHTAFPAYTINIAAFELTASTQGHTSNNQVAIVAASATAQNRNASTHTSPLHVAPPRVACIDLKEIIVNDGTSFAHNHREDHADGSPGPQTDYEQTMGTASVARRVEQLEELLSYSGPQMELELAPLEDAAAALTEEVSVLAARVSKWKEAYETGSRDRNGLVSSPDQDLLLSPPAPASFDEDPLKEVLNVASPKPKAPPFLSVVVKTIDSADSGTCPLDLEEHTGKRDLSSHATCSSQCEIQSAVDVLHSPAMESDSNLIDQKDETTWQGASVLYFSPDSPDRPSSQQGSPSSENTSPARTRSFSILENDLAADPATPSAAVRPVLTDDIVVGSSATHFDAGYEDARWFPSGKQESTFEGQDLVSASLNKVIELLTTSDHVADDDELMMAVVLMHRAVCTPRDFMRKMISRFHATHEVCEAEGSETDSDCGLVVMRHKVCSIILVWLRDFYRDFCDFGLVVILKAFLGMREKWNDDEQTEFASIVAVIQGDDLHWNSLVLVKDVMRRVLQDRLAILKMQHLYVEEGGFSGASLSPTEVVPESDRMPTSNPAMGLRVAHSKAWHILQLNAGDVAQQLTLMESRRFFAISYEDLLNVGAISWKVKGENGITNEIAPAFLEFVQEGTSLQAALQSSSRLSVWVASTIVSEPEHSRRVELISFFIAVADECHQLSNFSSMVALWRGLQAEPVRRLVRANGEAMQNPHTITMYAHMSQLCSSKTNSCQALMRLQDSLQDVPCVPLLDCFLCLLVNAQHDHGSDVAPNGQLNLPKARLVSQTVKRIVRHQHWRYEFESIKPVESYLSDLLVLDAPTLMSRSLACEPSAS